MDKYLLHSHTTEHNYKKELEYMQRHAWKKPETKVYTLIPHIYNFLENNTCYKKQETDWWFPGTGGEKGGLSVKDKVISGGGGGWWKCSVFSLWWGYTTDLSKICELDTKKSIFIVCIPQ